MNPRRALFSILLVSILIISIIGTGVLNDSNGQIEVEEISIPYGETHLKAVLYLPKSSTEPLPGVVLAHGISNSKETMTGIALELSKRGIAALSIDLIGHGGSGGTFGSGDPSLGMKSAVDYFRSKGNIDSEKIGVAGHSLGAGAARYVAFVGDVRATALIGGGIGDENINSSYGEFSYSSPENLLVAVGQFDILIEKETLLEKIQPAFPDGIVIGSTRGSFGNGTARKIITPKTIHLLEPVTPEIVRETVRWFETALIDEVNKLDEGYNPTYHFREIFQTLSLIAFTGLALPLSYIIKRPNHELEEVITDFRMLTIYAGGGLLLFFPSVLVGSIIPFPPLIFGSGMALWLALWGLGGLAYLYLTRKNRGIFGNLRELLDIDGLISGSTIFLVMYLISFGIEILAGVNLKMIVPLFRAFSPIQRFIVFPSLIPFFYLHFASEQLFFERMSQNLKDFILAKTGGLVSIIIIQYGALVLGSRVLPTFVGFLVEFLLAITPLLILTCIYSWWFGLKKGSPTTAITLNALIISWAAAGLFPLGSF